jgi:hypothetical protein
MAVLRRSAIPCLALVLLGAVAPAALAGVRVTEPWTTHSSTDSSRTSPSRAGGLEIGFGAAGGDLYGGRSAALALEVPAGDHVGVILRGEGAAFEQRADAFFFVATTRTIIGVLSLGARWNDEQGAVRNFIEGGIGVGRVHSNLFVGPVSLADDLTRACWSIGVGASWHPRPSPVGIFVEARMLTFMQRDPVIIFPARAGLRL